LLNLLSLFAFAQTVTLVPGMNKTGIKYLKGSNNLTPCIIWTPDDWDPNSSKKYPVIIAYHGEEAAVFPPGVSTPTDTSILLNNGILLYLKNGGKAQTMFGGQEVKFIVVAPQASSFTADTTWLNPNINDLTKRLLTGVGGGVKMDSTRIYLTSYSAGGKPCIGNTCLSTADSIYSRMIAASIPMSPATQDVNWSKLRLAASRNIHFMSFAGSLDPTYISQMKRVQDTIQRRSNNILFPIADVITGNGHCCWEQYWDSTFSVPGFGKNIFQWLLLWQIGASNSPPVVGAGSNQVVTLPINTTSLAGTAAAGTSKVVSTTWTQVSGPNTASIGSLNSLSTSLNGLIKGTYVFQLSATDSLGLIANSATQVSVQVTTPPVISAGGNPSIIYPVDSLTLTGSATKGTGGPIVSTAWTESSGPNTATIQSPDALVTKLNGLIAGTYVFKLSVRDSIGNISTDSATVTVYAANGNTINVRIYAGSNPFKNALWNNWNVGSAVVNNSPSGILKYSNGTPSTISAVLSFQDAMGDNANGYTKNAAMCPDTVLRYSSYTSSSRNLIISGLTNSTKYNLEFYASRARTDGQKTVFAIGTQSVTITTDNNSANAAKFSNISPANGQIVITINKTLNYSYLNGFKITAIVSAAPTVTAGSNQSIQLPANSVTLTGSAVAATGNTISSYLWTQTGGPAAFSITTPTAPATTVTGLVQGVYTFQLKATDNASTSGSATVQITVTAPAQAPLVPPTVTASGNQTISLPTSSVSLSETDNGNILSTTWSKLFSPGQKAKSIGIIGSSTSASTGLPTPDSGYVRRMQKYYQDLGLVDTVYNLSVPGYNVYQGMPSSYTPPSNRSLPSPDDNITTILARPNIGTVIVNFPSNGYDSFTVKEVMICLHTIYNAATAAGKACFITTTQPRPAFDANPEDTLRVLKDSILAQFGAHAINFYDGMVDPGTKNTQAIYAQSDGIHFNSLGHERLFQKVIAANMVSNFGSSSAVIASPANPATQVTGLTPGIHKFQVAVLNSALLNGSSITEVTVTAPTIAPKVNAGADQTITLPVDNLSLKGSDTIGTARIVTTLWSQLSGPDTAVFDSPDSLNTSITHLSKAGNYLFRLRATDSLGLVANDTIKVVVLPAVGPRVQAGSDQAIAFPANTVVLNGIDTAGSSPIVSVLWSQLSGAGGDSITTPASLVTTVTGLSPGSYSFRLLVTDSMGLSSSDTVLVNVLPPAGPKVNAGRDQAISFPMNSVTLSGVDTAGSSPIVISTWSLVDGPNPDSILVNTSNSLITIVSNLVQGAYRFRLSVTDSLGLISSDTVWVNVLPPAGPKAGAGKTQTIAFPVNFVTLSGADTAGGSPIVSLAWSLVSGPNPDSIQITTADTLVTKVTHLVPGTYIFQFSVTDSLGLSGSDSVRVNVLPPIGPKAGAGKTQTITFPVNFATLSGADTAGTSPIVSTLWSLVNGPNPDSVHISPATSLTTLVSNLVPGAYTFRLSVTDSLGLSSSGSTQVNVLPPVAAKVNAGGNKNDTLPANTITLTGTVTAGSSRVVSTTWSQSAGPNTATLGTPATLRTTIGNLIQGAYRFRLTAVDSLGTAVVDSAIVTVLPVPAPSTINVRLYGGDNPFRNPLWNNWNVGSGVQTNKTSPAFTYTDGTTSPVTAVLSGQDGLSDNGAPYRPAATMCPDTALRYDSYSTTAKTMTIKGLNNTHIYNLSIYCSRLRTDGQRTKVTIGSTTVTVLTDNNQATAASFTNVVPSGGNIVISLAPNTNYWYLNGFTIKDVTGTSSTGGSAGMETLSVAGFVSDSVSVAGLAGGFKVFPNPAMDHISVWNPNGNPLQIVLYTMDGRVVLVTRDLSSKMDIPVDHLAQGSYFLIATDENTREVFRRKIIKL